MSNDENVFPTYQSLISKVWRFPTKKLSNESKYIIFSAYDYQYVNKKNLQTIIEDKKHLVSIVLYFPNEFTDTLTHNWQVGKALSVASAFGNISDKLFGEIGEQILNRVKKSTGVIINPAEELLFEGPGLRDLRFSFDFIPENENDLKAIKMILVGFKRFSLPSLSQDSLTVKIPPIWTIDVEGFDPNNSQLDFVMFGLRNRAFALTSPAINYSPEAAYAAVQGGFPLKTSIELEFKEITPMYREDIENEAQMMEQAYANDPSTQADFKKALGETIDVFKNALGFGD